MKTEIVGAFFISRTFSELRFERLLETDAKHDNGRTLVLTRYTEPQY